MGVKIKTEVVIEAEPSIVYGVLRDLAKFEEWNPFIVKGEGEFEVNQRLKLTFANGMQFKPKVLVAEKDKELRWIGKLPIPRLFDGEHYFVLERQDNGSTLLHHGENFSGLLPPMMPKLMRETKQGFQDLNAKLKARCEAMKV